MSETLFTKVILPLALPLNYTYRVPREWNNDIKIGQRVIVQFGKNKFYTALVGEISTEAPKDYEAKYLVSILEPNPLVTQIQLDLWNWIASYYMCTVGEVYNAAFPSGLKLSSETKISLNPDVLYDKSELNDKEFLIIEALELKPELTLSEVSKILEQNTVMPLIKKLRERRIVLTSEELNSKYVPKKETFIYLNVDYENKISELCTQLEKKAPKQVDVLMAYWMLSNQNKIVRRKELLERSGNAVSALSALFEKGILSSEQQEVSRFAVPSLEVLKSYQLSDAQHRAYEEITSGFENGQTVLLHGVTASGKTQIYIKLIEAFIQKGKQALFLLPEIALTTQMIIRLQVYFGSRIGIYHSKYNESERAEVWYKVLNREYDVVLGARSAVFLPFQDLGLIVVDEEHENSYKQTDPAPRYHARDTALYLATLFNANVLLGSATPSFESYFLSKENKKYKLVSLTQRYGGGLLPEIQLADMAEARRKKQIKAHCSEFLLSEIEDTIKRGEQVILFQNRRGYAPMLVCTICNYTPKCKNCDVSLVYHRKDNQLHCHYCNHVEPLQHRCSACGSTQMEQRGFGTEKIEDELSIVLPSAKILRMDLDSTRGKNSFQKIIEDFDNKQFNVLVGTQMVTKGLDFENVGLIGVINADTMLNMPDFRASERSYQLISQVSGRAGRREKRGKVIVQTAQPDNQVLQWVMYGQYETLFRYEMAERSMFNYPPYSRMIQMDIKHKEEKFVDIGARELFTLLSAQLGNRVLGPIVPNISRIRNYFIRTITLKIERKGVSLPKVKQVVRNCIHQFYADSKQHNQFIIRIDVDPY